MGTKKRWRQEVADKAIAETLEGAKIVDLVTKYGILDKTLRNKIKLRKESKTNRRPGPDPVLGTEAEDDIHAWTNEVYIEIYGHLRSSGSIGRGWCDRFLARYPPLSLRMVQVIKSFRNTVTIELTRQLFAELAMIAIHEQLNEDRVFNMDETSFSQRSRNSKVIACAGSRNVWTATVEANFQLTVVACGSANGTVVPPIFVDSGPRLNRDVTDSALQPGAKITTAPEGFINADLFEAWLEHLAQSIPDHVKRSFLLIHDGCSSHSSDSIKVKAASLQILLMALLPNATHLFQPLNVAVFKLYKTVLKNKIREFMITSGKTTVVKMDAVGIALAAWEVDIAQRSENIVYGKAFSSFKAGGIQKSVISPAWLQVREHVRSEILSLPAIDHGKRRKTVDINKSLWTSEDLHEIE